MIKIDIMTPSEEIITQAHSFDAWYPPAYFLMKRKLKKKTIDSITRLKAAPNIIVKAKQYKLKIRKKRP